MSEEITTLQLKPYRIQRTYMKTSKYTLSLYIPPAETTILNNGYNTGVIGILYFQLPWQESKIKRSIEIRVRNQRKILRCLSEALNWFDNIVDLFVTQDNVLYFNTNSAKFQVFFYFKELLYENWWNYSRIQSISQWA